MENEKDEKVFTNGDLEFFGSIMTAMTKQSQFTQNAVEQSYIREIEELRENYIHLFRRILKVQDTAQRIDLERVIADHEWMVHQAQQPGWWSEDFNKNF